MPNSDSSGGIYSPIPQTTITDSESEEDLLQRHHPNQNHPSQRQFQHQGSKQVVRFGNLASGGTVTMMNGGGGSSGSGSKARAMSSGGGLIYARNQSQQHRHVVSGENGSSTICNNLYNGLPSPSGELDDANGVFHADNVAILHEAGPIPERKMSFPRKCCFVASLAVCFLSLVLFLWVIPCSDEMACPARGERLKTQNWIRNYERIELKGVINVVEGVRGSSKNLIFMYRADKLSPEESLKQDNGIISLVGNTGKVAWFDRMVNEPKSIDCTLIDADLNGSPDCLVMDEYGQLECINPLSGEWIWHSPVYDRKSILKQNDLLDFPLVIPDVDGDGVMDLFFITSNGTLKHNIFVIISGRKGKLIGESFTAEECFYVHKLMLDAEYNVLFNCVREKSEQQRSKPLTELFGLIKNETLDRKLLKKKLDLPQHKFYGQRKNTEKQRTITTVGGKQLVIENRGKCPENCSTLVLITEESTGKLLLNVSGRQLYGMQPVLLHFKNFASDNRSTIYGFVIKFWEWSQDERDNRSFRNRRSTTPSSEPSNPFAHLLVKKQTWVLPENPQPSKSRRSIKPNLHSGNYKTRMRYLKETIKLIVFNSTNFKIENTSQSNIIQLCRESVKDSKDSVCQPDLNYQENSLLIADLDDDGSQELVSYHSTFVKTEPELGGGFRLKLKTFVQLLRLESELPKLFNAIDAAKN